MIIAKAPGTCGEYLQGIYNKQPALISSPVSMYSTTIIKDGTGEREWQEKAELAYKRFLEIFSIDPDLGKEIDIKIQTELPFEKGMASSTADILSVIYALAAYFKKDLTEKQAAEIAISIEPSDNSMYKKLNVFNHYTGEVLEELNKSLESPVLILDFNIQINTIDFGYATEFFKSEELSEQALELFKKGLIKNDISLIGKAITMSAENNQTALEHPYFNTIKHLVNENHGLGLLIGHSGSVIGVLYDETFNKEKFLEQVNKKFKDQLDGIYDQKLISGGVSVEEIPE